MCHIILVIKVGWKCMINMIYNTFFAKYCIYPPFWYLPLKLFDQSKPWGKICSNLATTATTKFLLRNHLLPHAECTQPHFFYIHTIILTISLNAEEAFFKRCCYMEATDFCNTPKWNYNLSQWKFVYKSWAVSHNFFFFMSDIDSFILSGFLVLDFMKLNVSTTLNATKWGFNFW